jgi:meso-butanediol dehydrogenase/(S,S)-butanediol dehydrogenase/diacetyl reductase
MTATDPHETAPVALVTGAASGIGRATAFRLATSGYRVVAVDRDPAGLARLADELTGTAGLDCRTADLADPEVPAVLVADAAARWGRLDLLALVAGIGQRGPATSIPLELWDQVIDVNLRAPFLLAREAFSHLKATGGSVVAVSSLAGLQGWPYAAAYSASKGGLITLMRTLALEFGVEGVRVNIVSPGSVDTGLATGMRQAEFEEHPALHRSPGGIDGRTGTPEEIAAVIAFLGSPAASYVNGAVLRADGGAYA